MPRFSKLLARPGRYQSRDGEIVITPARIRHWVSQFKEMKAAGLRHPLPWGHQSKAKPATEAEQAELEYWRSKYNAGYLHDLDESPEGEMVLTGDSPFLEVDPETQCLVDKDTRTAVGEMSLACQDFTDGQGRVWPDAIIHAALVTHPVWHGQPGFEPADMSLFRLSLDDFLPDSSEKAMDDEPKKAEEPKKEDKPKEKSGGGGGGDCKKSMDMLAKRGIVLPDDTDEASFHERLYIALTALEGNEPEAPEMPKEDKGEGKVEEEPPMMMSLEDRAKADPLVAGLLARTERDSKAAREKRIQKLIGRGLPVHVANKLRQQASLVRLSLTATGDFEESEVDRTLALLESSLPEQSIYEFQSAGKPEEVTPPEGMTTERSKEVADTLSRTMGAGRRTA